MKKPIYVETTFGPYTRNEILGEGGAGRVYGGTDGDRNLVAVKILTSDRITTDKRRRFKNETAFLLRTRHPHIVDVSDHGVHPIKSVNCPFYAMARYKSNLRHAMKQE